MFILWGKNLTWCPAHTYHDAVSAWVLIPPYQTTTWQFFLSLQALKKLTSPLMQTQNPDNSNMSFMFNNNTYSDFRTAYKHVLIPSYVIQWFNKTKMSQNYTLIGCLANTGQDQHLKLSPQRHVLQVFFLTRNIVSSPPDKYLW